MGELVAEGSDFLGMGTEAIVFFLAAFDRPFDKKEIGKDLAKDFQIGRAHV